MKVYFVLEAPYMPSEDMVAFMGLDVFSAAPFQSEDEAVSYAQELAMKNLGKSFWVVEGSPTKAFRCEPLPVIESAPNL